MLYQHLAIEQKFYCAEGKTYNCVFRLHTEEKKVKENMAKWREDTYKVSLLHFFVQMSHLPEAPIARQIASMMGG